jgi:hypothetical protein
MNNFQAWLDQADIPTCDENGWFDLETGLRYNPAVNYLTGSKRQTISTNALTARNIAKAFGGKALKGTKKQKEWAEKIRADKVQKMTRDQAEMVCDPNGLLTHSKFWIENCDASPTAIGHFVMTQKALLAQYRASHAAGDADQVAKIAAEYNALTEEWGF